MGLISETRMTNFINISSSTISIVQSEPVIVYSTEVSSQNNISISR